MGLSNDLITQFVKVTNDKTKEKSETKTYGTIVEYNGKNYIRMDGSELLTPMSSTVSAKDGDRVTVTVKDHRATVDGNLSDPAASSGTVNQMGNRVTELVADNLIVKDTLIANKAEIDSLIAEDVVINGLLTANEAEIDNLKANKLDASIAVITYATIGDLEATNASIHNLEATYGDFEILTTNKFDAVNGVIENLDSTYANIDFANIGEAAVEKIFASSGIIKDLIMSGGYVTGELVGVTFKGDLIEGNTIVADKLVIKGDDGLYYKLNTNGVTTEAEQTEYNSLNGSVIIANSITASKINVTDLVAFDATIGGFKITDTSLYSGVKSTVDNTTKGVYLDSTGQIAFGDANNYVKFYKDTNGADKLDISAQSLRFSSSGKSVETYIQDVSKLNLNAGKMLYSDPTFANGYNSTGTYNNSANGNVVLSREDKSIDNPMTNTDYELVISNIGTAAPALGGFYFGNASRANAVFVYRIVAKIPSGYTLQFASNSVGGVYSGTWLTSKDGNDKFVEYIYRIQCGTSGTFSTTGYFYIDGPSYGTTDNPVKWYVAYATCFDMSGVSDTLQLKSDTDSLSNDISATNTRIDNAELLIDNLNKCISMLVTDNNGESLMTQTSTGWTFSMASMNSAINGLSDSISNLQSSTGSTEATINKLQNAVNDLEGTAEYVRISSYQSEPCIELGKSGSDFRLMITNTRIMFMRGSSIPTYIDTTGLVTENITINGELHHGKYVWKQRSNGNYGLQYTG